MESLFHLLLLTFLVGAIHAQIPGTGSQEPVVAVTGLSLGNVRNTGREFSLEVWQGNPVSWREWTTWSGCTGSCGVGTQERRRECWFRREIVDIGRVPDIAAASSGSSDQSPNTRQGRFSDIVTGEGCYGYASQARGCALTPCIGTLGPWTVWSGCSAPCGEGSQFRTRVCQGPGECIEETFETRGCNAGPCYTWTQWTSYSACSGSCGQGQSFRSRRCAASDGSNAPSLSECPDPTNEGAFQSQPCNLGDCYAWTQWTSYSTCSAPCGAGQSFRSRRCAGSDGSDAPSLSECPDPSNLGAFQSQACNLGPCYQWTEWTEYTSCSASCGPGQISRSRRCVDIATNIDSPSLASCPDPSGLGAFQSQPCNLGACYSWTQWSSYSTCSAPCGDGQTFRSRRCAASDGSNAPSLSECPDPTNAGAFQSQACNLGPCYSWTQWTSYSVCSESCGNGQSFRSRRCAASDGSNAPSLSECPDPSNLGAFQSQTCNLGPCYGWTAWTEYTVCSATCGSGSISRSRRCVDLATNIDSPSLANCDDPQGLGAFQSQPCNLGPCYSWTQWTSYSQCSETCGNGQSFRSRRCAASDGSNAPSLSECPDPSNAGAFQSQACNLGPCYGWTAWTEYTACSATCGSGSISRSRRCVDLATNIDSPSLSSCADPLNLGAFQSQPCNLGPCYSWTQWTSYSQCSETCGNGQSFRSRRCAASDGSNAPSLSECPDPSNAGAFQSQACNLGPCYGWTAWTEYTVCSATCGNGQISRSRRCVDLATNIDSPSLANCDDPQGLGAFQSQPCNLGPCYSWTQWTSYSECSQTCGNGQSFRSRRCAASDGSNAPSLSECPDPTNAGAFQSQTCNLGPCYGWTAWTEYTVCSATCGNGQISRSRRCVDLATNIDSPSLANCDDPQGLGSFQSQPCNLGPCYSWTQWTSYSQCSETCGNGQSFRSRRCAASDGSNAPSLSECPDPSNAGAFQSQACNLGPCYGWTAWTEYTVCSATCGSGSISRSRRCVDLATNIDSPSLANCDDPQNLGAFQSQPCNLGPCYGWTVWTEYSVCSATCGDGQISRSRRCVDLATNIDSPSLSNCDDPQNLGAFQSQPCNLGPCYSWTQWTSYSECSASCGNGQSFRSRRCAASDGSNAPSQSECPDPTNAGAFQSQACNLGPCYEWTLWTDWSQCSRSCDAGQISRSRRCVDIATNTDAPSLSSCSDPLNLGAFQSQACNLGPCYSWTQWTSYSECSQTCGDGQSFRTRRCAASDGSNSPNLAECPDPTNAGAFQSQNCNLGPCYGWASWSSQSDCSVTCGVGEASRRRRCQTDKGEFANDENCAIPGQPGAILTETCRGPRCYSYTQWTAYSECSQSCGAGQIFRSRQCVAEDNGEVVSATNCIDVLNLGTFQSQTCNLGPCYRFAQWGSWSKCDSRCGQGNMQRTRTCVTTDGQPGPNAGCSNDPNDFIIRATCMKRACPGVFRQWAQWGECSLTCHGGVRIRTRQCTTERCIGRSREAQICNDFACEVRPQGTWTAWSNWTPCTQPCGGTSTQTRVCVGGRTATDCGRDCEEYRRTRTCTDCPRGGSFSIGSCQVVGILKQDCGFGGISAEECTNVRNCCYDDTVPAGEPWCYRQSGTYSLNALGRSLGGASGGLGGPPPTVPDETDEPTPPPPPAPTDMQEPSGMDHMDG